jgi:hypothetical protein
VDLSKPPSECILFVINQRREMGAGTYPEAKQAKELAARYHSCARPPLCRDDQSRCTGTAIWARLLSAATGRYFVPVLSLVAVVVTAVVNCAPDEWLSAAMAISGAVLSGGASVEAILRGDWNL